MPEYRRIGDMLSSAGHKAKVKKVMGEFKAGKLNSGSGGKVTNPKQALAIALSVARKSK